MKLKGNSTAVPFDQYVLKLKFRTFIECKPETNFDNIYILDYNDLTKWDNSWDIDEEEGDHFSSITITNNLTRRIESAYIFVIPAMVCFFLLGGSHLICVRKKLANRLTIYLTIFVFLLGSFSINQIIRDMIPDVAYGITTAELVLAWLAGYLGVYLILSLLGNFCEDLEIRGIKISLILDVIAFIIVLGLFFFLPVINIQTPNYSEILSLYSY